MIDNINRYVTFIAVAESGSISDAAKQLYVSQPAVSTEIAALEKALCVKLFFRSNRGVGLTPEGKLLYDNIKIAFSFIEAGEDKLREVTGLRSGQLRIGVSDMTLRFFLLDYITRFRQLYPDVRLSVSGNPTPKTLDGLRSGQIDIGVISGPIHSGDEKDFVFLPVKQINDVFIASPASPLAGEKQISKCRLTEYPLVMLEKRTNSRRYIDEWFGADYPYAAIELSTSDMLLEFARRGIGAAAIVEDFASEAIAKGEVVKLDIARPPKPRTLYAAYLRRLPPSAAAARIIEMLEKNAEAEK